MMNDRGLMSLSAEMNSTDRATFEAEIAIERKRAYEEGYRAGLSADRWQDISSAPRDGTEILCWHSGLAMGAMVLSFYDGYWREKANGMGLKTEPSHWQPLPAPSTRELQDGGEG